MSATRTARRGPRLDPEATREPRGRPLPLWYTLLLVVVLVTATGYGLLAEGAYPVHGGVRADLPDIMRGQDLVTLLAAGALLWGGIRAHRGSLAGHVVWLAVCLYSAYTYLMYVVAPYNDALLLYIAAIGLATYGLINGLVRLDAVAVAGAFGDVPRRGLAWFLIVVGALFATMWLVDILSVWPGGTPADLFVDGFPSIVHVLDLAIVLPLLVLTGVLLLRGHPVAPVLAAIVLVKTLTLGLALLSMIAFSAAAGGTPEPGEAILWSAVVLMTSVWLVRGARRMEPIGRAWLRPSVWEPPIRTRPS